jgi:hypothetical protein
VIAIIGATTIRRRPATNRRHHICLDLGHAQRAIVDRTSSIIPWKFCKQIGSPPIKSAGSSMS